MANEDLKVGQYADRRGDITWLKAIGARDPTDIERMLGFHLGRLRRGYWICLLAAPVAPSDFKLAGLTLRSGGREGLPASSREVDLQRVHVSDRVIGEYGVEGAERLKQIAASRINQFVGSERTAKVIPVMGDAGGISPNVQYPPGGGAPQWTLLVPKRFLVAAKVEDDLTVHLPQRTFKLGADMPYEDRAALARYLESAS